MMNINKIKDTAILIFIAGFSVINLAMPYSLKVDYSLLKPFISIGIAFFVLLAVIELAIYLITGQKKQGYPVTLLLSFIVAINIKTIGIVALKLSDKPYLTSRAFVLSYHHHSGRRSLPSSYTLLFPDKQDIELKKINISSNGYRAIKGECLNVKYRENVLVVEVRPIKEKTRDLTLLQKSQKECLK